MYYSVENAKEWLLFFKDDEQRTTCTRTKPPRKERSMCVKNPCFGRDTKFTADLMEKN